MPAATARQRTTRIVLTLVQIIVLASYVMSPFSAFADEDPAPSGAPETPAPTESAVAATETQTESSVEATPTPTESAAPATPAPTPATPAPLPATPAPAEAAPVVPPPALPAGTVPYIVTFDAGTTPARQAEIIAAVGVTDVSSIPQLAMHGVLLHDWQAADESDALRSFAEVARVDEDRTREAGAVPSDADFGSQWALPQIGWTDLFGSVAPAASATVAVLDTGIDGSHWDLDQVVRPGSSMLDGGNGLTDPNGHGTAMAGIVAAETDNAFGVAGTAYAGVSLLPVTVLDADGLGQDSDIIAGVVYAADAGADVILMAFSNPGYSPALQAALDYAWSRGAVLVAAAGNDGSTAVTYPAGDRGVIGVAATDTSDALAPGSNSGAAVFMAAPGIDVLTTAVGGGVGAVSGTSAAAAEVAGAAALLRALDPGASNGAIVGRLARNADATTSTGTGNGRLNMARAAADASTEEVQPAGAAPLGSGGPIVGPYVAAARNWALVFDGAGGGSVQITPNTGLVDAETGCGGTGASAGSQTVTSTCETSGAGRVTTSSNGALITLQATPSSGSSFAGWSAGQNISGGTCFDSPPLDLTNPCTVVFSGNGTITVSFAAAVNAAPLANDDGYATNEDTGLSVAAPGVLGNDTDADGNTLTAVLVSGPTAAQGALTLNANGSFSFTPAPNFNGQAAFTYRANDGTANSNTATVTITVNAVDDAPVAVNDATAVLEDSGTTTIDVLANDSDADAGPKTVASVTQPGNGSTAVTNAGADLSYTPNADSCGTDTFAYTLNGGSSATVTVTVTCVNDAPAAADDSATVLEDSFANQIFVLANDTDADDDTPTVVSVSDPANGSASAQLSHVTYTPDADFNGTDTFTYTITDGHGGTSTATVTVIVGAVNDAPVAEGDIYSTNEDEGLTEAAPGILGNDSDVDLDALAAALVDDVTHGVLALNADGGFTYTPNADFNGSDSFTYTAGDGSAASNVATVSITIIAINDAPVLAPIGDQAVNEEVELAFNASASDVDGDALSFTLADGAAGDVPSGAIISPAGAFSWTPTELQGPGQYTFDVCVSDATADPVCETITVTVNEVNVAPVLDPIGDGTLDEGSTLTFTASASDEDLPANGLAFSLANGTGGSVPAGASIDPTTGAFSWTPADDQVATFDVCVTDDGIPAMRDCETITVTVNNVAPAVSAGADATIDEGGTFSGSGSFSDPGADTWRATVDYGDGSAPETLSLNPDKSFSLSHTYADNGLFTVTVTVDDDDTSGSDTLLVTVDNVAPDYSPPSVDAPANQGAQEGVSKSFDIGSFTDAGINDNPWAVSIDWGDSGTTSFNALSQSDLTDESHLYLDDGVYLVSVTVTDKDGGTDSSTFSISVANVAPTVSAGADATIDEGGTFSGSGSFSDPGADPWSATVDYGDGSAPETLSLNPDKSFSLSHSYADNGLFTVTVTVDDDDTSGSDTLLVTVNNVAPDYAAPTDQSSLEGQATSFDLGSFTDPGADSPWRVTIGWGDGSADTVLSQATPATIAPQSHDYADNGSYTVTVTVAEENGTGPGSDSGAFNVVVANVAPEVTSTFLSIDPVTRIVSASASWNDPGADAYSVQFEYFLNGSAAATATRTVTPTPPTARTASDNVTQLPAGCYTLTMKVTVTDDDSGVGIGNGSAGSGAVAAYAAAFQAPIRDNERNIAKYGNVVPVKLQLTNPCTGAAVITPSLFITIVQGNVSDDTIDDTPNLVAESVSNADSGAQMRLNGSGYIYNFSTKQLKPGNDYTIRIRVGDTGGPIIAKALFQPKK